MLVKHCEHLLTFPLNKLLNLLGGLWTFGGDETLTIVEREDSSESEEI